MGITDIFLRVYRTFAFADQEVLWVTTTKTSLVIKEFLNHFHGAVVYIEDIEVTDPISTIDRWCTRKNLASIVNFSIFYQDRKILQFHDDSRQMAVSREAFDLVTELALKRWIRYEWIKGRI